MSERSEREAYMLKPLTHNSPNVMLFGFFPSFFSFHFYSILHSSLSSSPISPSISSPSLTVEMGCQRQRIAMRDKESISLRERWFLQHMK